MTVELALQADGDRQDRGDEKPEREVDVAGEWQGA
jgi:hypothetical protein